MSTEDAAIDCRGGGSWELPAAIIQQLANHEQAVRAAANSGAKASVSSARRRLEKAALVRVRRDQATLSPNERNAFNRALRAMVEEGTYDLLARLASDPSRKMTGGQGAVGLHRFLPWHRRYLWEFESQLQRIDCRLRPNDLPLALPYWNWLQRPPTWLTDFSDNDATLLQPAADDARLKPTPHDLELILHGFSQLLPSAGVGQYVKFTFALEGWACRPDRTPLPGHNQVQAWLERIVQQSDERPMHPIFWLHLAQVDRLWCLWQAEHPGLGPVLAGPARLLDPWPQTADEMLRPESIGYVYE